MLPARNSARPSLADVLPSSLSAILGRPNALSLPPVSRTVVFVLDGLGVNAIRELPGHARTLAGALSKSSTMRAGFPTTTASGLATITTGEHPGVHGMVGYTSLDPANDRVVQLLTGWDAKLDPATWQRSRTVFERAVEEGIPAFAIGIDRFRGSGFSSAVLRGAEFLTGRRVADRVAEARRVLDTNDSAIVYVYAAEFDHAVHQYGLGSAQAVRALEELDAAVAALVAGLGRHEGLLVIADHGSVDVPATSHVLFDHTPGLLDGIRHIAGEPRALQLHYQADASPGVRESVTARWRETEGDRAVVVTRDEAIAGGWFGPIVDPAVVPRIGDLIVAARKAIAYYDSRTATARSQAMVGQHGSLAPEETVIPLLRFGAYRR